MEAIVINSRKLKYKKKIQEEQKFNEIILKTRNNLVKSCFTNQNKSLCNSTTTAFGFIDVTSGKGDKTDSEELVLSNNSQISNEYIYANNVYAAPSNLDLEQVLTPYYYEKDDVSWINELISYEWLVRKDDTL